MNVPARPALLLAALLLSPAAPLLTGTLLSGTAHAGTFAFPAVLPRKADGWYALGVQATRAGDPGAAARAFAQAAALNPTAANWRALADAYVALGDYTSATDAYTRAAARYRAQGDNVTARALEYKAAPYRQTIDVRLVTAQTGSTQPRLARLEPARGILLGAYAPELSVTGVPPRLSPERQDFAVIFRYWDLKPSRSPDVIFPHRHAQAARTHGQALHIALEPAVPLRQVTDAMLSAFAKETAKAGLPVFVRFAAEMNDPQNEWSRDPALYRSTFQRLARALHQHAPNAATVWMPMPGDLTKIGRYYPGPDAVDWAGLSLYSLPFENGNVRAPRLNAHPLDLVDGFYARYAPAHPIQLSEYAASHRSGAAASQDHSDFAARQLREVYWGAWIRYPRLKNINWLDLNMLTGEANGKSAARRNDYRLFASPAKWQAFQDLRTINAFQRRFQKACLTCTVSTATPWPARVPAHTDLSGVLWLQTATPPARVQVTVNGQDIPTAPTLPHTFRFQATPGTHRLTVTAYSASGQLMLRTEKTFQAQ